MPNKKYKRRKKLINSGLQLRLVGTFLAVACLSSLFQVALLNKSMMRLVHETPPETSEQLLMRIPGMLASNVLLTLGVLLPVMFAVGVLVTHRVAGPAYGMEKYLRRIGAGDVPEHPCRIRKGDELGGLCDAVNLALARMSDGAFLGEPTGSPPEGGEPGSEEPPSLADRSSEQPVEG